MKNNIVNIPVYRALKLGTKDEYVEGFLIPHNPDMQDGIVTFEEAPMEMDTGHVDVYTKTHSIDYSTLAINFPNMTDSENNPIFASLSEDGKGGDIMKDGYNEKYICLFNNLTNSIVLSYSTIQYQRETIGIYKEYWKTYTVTGIQE